MTIRAIVLGLILAAAFACWHPASAVWTRDSGSGGDLVPNYVYGVVLIGLLLVNPALGRLGLRRFKSSEWVLVLSMALMGAAIAGSALLWTFPHPVIAPIHNESGKGGKDLLQYIPDVMLVDAKATAKDPIPEVVREYMQGKGRQGEPIGLGEVPWKSWAPTLSFWFALLGLIFVGGICAAVVVHRQWSRREHLTYPIAVFAGELLGNEQAGGVTIFRRKIFWVGLGVSFLILVINGLHLWYPAVPGIDMGINFTSLRELDFMTPFLKVPLYDRYILNVNFFFAAVGLAYLLSGEVSFSLGISCYLYVLCVAPLVARGVDMSSYTFRGGLPLYMYFGSYLGMGIMVVYLGRRFYWKVLKGLAFVRDRSGDVLAHEVWAARLGTIACVLLVVLLWRIGLHPVLAIGFVVLIGLIFLMVGRVNAATGLFVIQQMWHPLDVLAGALGIMALGPHAMGTLAMLCIVVTLDTRIAVVPLVLNALRLGDQQRAAPSKLAAWMAVAVIVAMVIGVGLTVWMSYNFGQSSLDTTLAGWVGQVPKMPFTMLENNTAELTEDQLAQASRPFQLSRVLQARPTKGFYTAAGVGLALVLGCSYMRLRFARWPLHPVIFLVWGTPWMVVFAPSFLLAWLLKGLIMKYGGQSAYVKSRRFFIGLVVGEIAAAVLWAVVSIAYYLYTGEVGETFTVRPNT